MSKRVAPQWTPEQAAAIAERDHDLYVTAAAGSGKTAVLTERVVQLVTERNKGGGADGADGVPREPASLERLLVITFTRKAAREMRERIEKRLRRALDENPESADLRAALDAMPRSNILTLDAFNDRLVRRHFHRAGVAPDVRIADEDEERELIEQATNRAFEELARDDGERGREFAGLIATAGGAGGSVLENVATRVHMIRSWMGSLEDPERWLEQSRMLLQRTLAAETFEEMPESELVVEALAASLVELAEALDDVARRAEARFGAEAIESTTAAKLWSAEPARMRDHAERLRVAETADQRSEAFGALEAWQAEDGMRGLEKMKNKGVCGGAMYGDVYFRKQALERFGDSIGGWRERWFALGREHWAEATRMAAVQSLALLNLAEHIDARVARAKRTRGVLGFADMSRAALRLLVEPDGSGCSDIADEYQDFFTHVLVDEYQDISPLQDALIRRLSHADQPYPSVARNLFAVGDLKQSIYRFRRADPLLFRSRLESSTTQADAQEPSRRIGLLSNFRSLPGILHAVNAIFERLMDREVGEMEYDDEARLRPERPEHDLNSMPSPNEENRRPCVEAHWIDKNARIGDVDVGKESGEESGNAAGGQGAAHAASGDGELRLARTEREAIFIAARVEALTDPETGLLIPDGGEPGAFRRARPADCAILVRGLSTDLDLWVTTFAARGLRVQAAAADPEDAAPELSDVIAALRLADNPLNDIALATVMRSPMFEFSDDDLLALRAEQRRHAFHEAVWRAAGRWPGTDASQDGMDADKGEPKIESLGPELADKLDRFLTMLDRWRDLAARTTPEQTLDAILVSTNFEAHLAGRARAGELQDELNRLRLHMRAFGDRTGSASGMTDFLASLDHRSARRSAEAAGPEDSGAVHLLTMHSSKGLEFPIVFLARLDARFEGRGSRTEIQFAKEHAMASIAVDPDKRVRLVPPGFTALHDRDRRAQRAEEFRLLYVAMTRAREKLILIGTAKTEELDEMWEASAHARAGCAPAYWRMRAAAPIDLLGPVLNHILDVSAPAWLGVETHTSVPLGPHKVRLPRLRDALSEFAGRSEEGRRELWSSAQREFDEVLGDETQSKRTPDDDAARSGTGESSRRPSLDRIPLILASDRRRGLSAAPLKETASGIARRAAGRGRGPLDGDRNEFEMFFEAEIIAGGRGVATGDLVGRRPMFIQTDSGGRLDPAARGRATHALLQHMELSNRVGGGESGVTEAGLRLQAEALIDSGLIDGGLIKGDVSEVAEFLDALDLPGLARFFETELGRRLRERAGSLSRELPFTRWVEVSESAEGAASEAGRGRVIVQGIIDCVIDEGDFAVIIDYKTDRARSSEEVDALVEQYRPQIAIYRSAIEAIWKIPVTECWLAFLHAGENRLIDF